jgi:capping protein alpha
MYRAELAKSLAAYTKNHFPAGHSSVNCSQHPLLPPASGPPVFGAFDESTPAALDSIPEKDTSKPGTDVPGGIVTDVVEEQVASGDAEPTPTPAVGEIEQRTEEVDMPGGLEKVDEKVEEAKVEAGEEGTGEKNSEGNAVGGGSVLEEPKVEEVPTVPVESSGTHGTDSATSIAATTAAPAPAERKQERIDNPTFTLEIVGNKYNPSNFW